MMEAVDDNSLPADYGNSNNNMNTNEQHMNRSPGQQRCADGSDADSDSIGSGPTATDSNGSLRDAGTTCDNVASDHCRSDVCTTVSVATDDAAPVSIVDNAPVKEQTSMFVDPTARGEITRPVGWLTQSSIHPAVLQTRHTSSADVVVQTQLAPTRQMTLTSPIPSLIVSLRESAITAVKRTRQSLSERLGHGSRTVDTELEARVDALRSAQQRYISVLTLARSFITNFNSLVISQQALGAAFAEMSQKMPELHEEFAYNAETQRVVYKNGETLLCALNFFTSTLNTLCFKTIEDTLLTVKQYEDARVEYDAFRVDVELRQPVPEVQQRFEQHKQKFERLRQVLDVKLKFLDENKVKVMHQQLILFHNALTAFFSGNQLALEDTLQQFGIKMKSPNSPSWLEKLP